MYEQILVPLDGSKRAETILPHVEEMAGYFHSDVLLLRVVEPEVIYASSHGMVRDAKLEQEALDAHVREARDYLSGVESRFEEQDLSIRSMVEIGAVVQTIIDQAEVEQIDLIAMASHGRTGLSHVFYGSVAAGVLHRVDRPLLLVRAE